MFTLRSTFVSTLHDKLPLSRIQLAGSTAPRPGKHLVAGAVLAVGMTFGASAYATMTCYSHPGGTSGAPADGDTLCWADAELPKAPVTINIEMGNLAYLCDPDWFACTSFTAVEGGLAGPGGSFGGIFWIAAQFVAEEGDPCCFGAVYQFVFDPEGTPRPPPRSAGRNAGPPCEEACAADPVHVGTGNSYQREVDYMGAGVFPLRFERHYNSLLGVQSRREGWRWKHTYERSVVAEGSSAVLLRETGRALYFEEGGGVWTGDADVPGRLEPLVAADGTPSGWRYVDEDDAVEVYDDTGTLLSITSREGFTHALSYDTSQALIQVTGPFGRTLVFTYDAAGQLKTLADPAGNLYRYAHNANGNLASVTYPDATPGDLIDNPVRQYHYADPAHPDALTGITDENGVLYVTWSYDEKGRVTANSLAGGASSATFVYDDTAGTTTLTDASGAVRTYGFETIAERLHVASVSGPPCTTGCGARFAAYTQDTNGYPASRTDHNGHVTTFVHDARGLEVSRTEAVGTAIARTVTTVWHPTLRLPVLLTEPGKSTAFTYDAKGRLLTRTETDTASGRSRTVTNTYNAQGLLATRNGPRTDVADVTTFAYDEKGNLIETTNALGHTSRVTAYDPHGRPLTLEDPNGLVTTLSYDARGRLTARDVGGQVTTFAYDGVGNVTKATLPDGSFLASTYDAAHRLVALEDNLGNRLAYTLDAAGNRIAETVKGPDGTVTRTRARVYDTLNRLVRDIGGAGQTTDFVYDPTGNRTAVTVDSAGLHQRTEHAYDALHRLVASLDPLLGETAFGYDARDNLVSVTDAEGLTTTYTYDGLENLVTQTSPDTGVTVFTHDAAGNRLTKTDARGVITTFTYDVLNRLTGIEYPTASKNVTFSYDAAPNGLGHLTGITDASGSTAFAYDLRGNLVTETRTLEGVAYATHYAYDVADLVIATTYPSGTVVTTPRDAIGRIAAVSATVDDIPHSLATELEYLPFGPLRGFDYGNGLPLTRSHDLDYRLTAHTTGSVQSVTLEYDAADNITALTDGLDPIRSQNFAYDALNRLTAAEGPYGTQAFAYDAIGNRLSLETIAGTDTYAYEPGSHHLASIAGPSATDFAYDANGNTTAKGPLTFTYDDTNRLTEAYASGLQVGAYVYNAKGERVTKTAGGETTVFHYDARGQLIAESDAVGNTLREYVYLEGAPLALVENGTAGGSEEEPIDETTLRNIDAETMTMLFPIRLVRQINSFVVIAAVLNTSDEPLSAPLYVVFDVATPESISIVNPDGTTASGKPYVDLSANMTGDTLTPGETTGSRPVEVLISPGVPFNLGPSVFVLGDDAPDSTTTLYFFHNEHLGTPQRLTAADGSVIWEANYEPFGSASLPVATVTNNLRFPGQYFDEETGLHYNYFRDHEPGTGRYIASDPIGLVGGSATYIYVGQNPIRYSDPFGLVPPGWVERNMHGREPGRARGIIGFSVASGSVVTSITTDGPAFTALLIPSFGVSIDICSVSVPNPCEVDLRSRRSTSDDFLVSDILLFRNLGISVNSRREFCMNLGVGIATPFNRQTPTNLTDLFSGSAFERMLDAPSAF